MMAALAHLFLLTNYTGDTEQVHEDVVLLLLTEQMFMRYSSGYWMESVQRDLRWQKMADSEGE